MNELLLELSDTEMFNAVLNYAFMRDKIVATALRSIDPFKNPTEMARNQGISIGLFDLRDYILLLKKKMTDIETSQTVSPEGKGK